ncbi:MAG: winged helix-turn-helix transcriptional regulator [Saprospiraceae bacterium]|nr:winged helix-turn-helix transcriptional regulator [Saprospiraceae bacterium]
MGLLAVQTLSLNAVAENFNISRPAVSKHVKVLSECGLIEIKQHGRERICEAKLEQLGEVSSWVEQYRQFWESKFDALELYLQNIQKK